MSGVSVHLPILPVRPEEVLPYAALVAREGLERLWSGQPVLYDPYQAFAYAAGWGVKIPLGTAVTLMPLRHPLEAAMQARGLAFSTGQSVVAGYGPGAAKFQRSLLGASYRSPLGAAREYLTIMRAVLDGEPVDVQGDYFSLNARVPRVPHAVVDLGLGVLRPGMARLAGEVADTALTWLTPAEYIRDVLVPATREGAAAAGRKPPRVVASVSFALTEDGRDPRKLAAFTHRGHIQGPHYQRMWDLAGVRIDGTDVERGARGLLDAGLFLHGSASDVVKGLQRYFDAGVDEIALFQGGAAKRTVKENVDELHELLSVYRSADAGC